MNSKVYIDIETSGFSQQEDKIIEIAALKIDQQSKVRTLFHSFFYPEKQIDKKISAITNLTNEFLQQSPTFEKKADEFLTFIAGTDLFVFNEKFVIGFLNSELQKSSNVVIKNTTHDLLKLSQNIYKTETVNLDFLIKVLKVGENMSKNVFNEILILPIMFNRVSEKIL